MTNPAFTGSVAELDSEFVTHVSLLLMIVVVADAVGLPEFLRNVYIKSYSDCV